MNRTVNILQHDIKYYYESDQEIPEHEEEHVSEMITNGFTSGELNDNENRGWWSIDN